jgi:hypothetical protein
MPKEEAMTQISRPFQIALAAMVLFAAVWFVALRGHSAGSSGAGSSVASSSSAPSASNGGAGAASPSSQGKVYHGAAPGVAGLTRAIAKARGAVAQAEQSDRHAQGGSAPAAGAKSTPSAGSTSKAQSQTAPKTASKTSAATHAGASKAVTPSKSAATSSNPGTPGMQATVEAELHQGKVVAILFWNPKGSVDVAVHRELQSVGRSLGGTIAVHSASSSQVGAFGSFTRTVQVLATPTILMINKKGQTSSLNGLTDAFSIKQAIEEAKHAQ